MRDYTLPGFISRLKKRVINWDDDKITLSKIGRYKHVKITIVINGAIKNIVNFCYNSDYYIDLIAPKLIEYFNTGQWDDAKYYIKYGNEHSGRDWSGDYSRVFPVKDSKDTDRILHLLRRIEGDEGCGIKEVPKDRIDVNNIFIIN